MSHLGLIIERHLKCGLCGTEFEARCAIYKEDEVGYTHPDMIPGCQVRKTRILIFILYIISKYKFNAIPSFQAYNFHKTTLHY